MFSILILSMQISESDDLSKSMCRKCCDFLEDIRVFFEKCFSANQAQIIHFRKTRGSMLDLEAHINQYVRSYNPPIVPHIKLEPLVDFDEDDEAPDYREPDDDDDDEDYDQGSVAFLEGVVVPQCKKYRVNHRICDYILSTLILDFYQGI